MGTKGLYRKIRLFSTVFKHLCSMINDDFRFSFVSDFFFSSQTFQSPILSDMIISIKVNPFDVQQLQEGVIDENDELKNAFILEPHAGTLFENCHESLIFGERIEVRLFLIF